MNPTPNRSRPHRRDSTPHNSIVPIAVDTSNRRAWALTMSRLPRTFSGDRASSLVTFVRCTGRGGTVALGPPALSRFGAPRRDGSGWRGGPAGIAEKSELTRRQVADVFEALESVIERHVRKGAVGACTIPGLMKIKVVKKPARKARKNVPNPFRPGETMDVTAKPASTAVKVLPLKKLKDMA